MNIAVNTEIILEGRTLKKRLRLDSKDSRIRHYDIPAGAVFPVGRPPFDVDRLAGLVIVVNPRDLPAQDLPEAIVLTDRADSSGLELELRPVEPYVWHEKSPHPAAVLRQPDRLYLSNPNEQQVEVLMIILERDPAQPIPMEAAAEEELEVSAGA